MGNWGQNINCIVDFLEFKVYLVVLRKNDIPYRSLSLSIDPTQLPPTLLIHQKTCKMKKHFSFNRLVLATAIFLSATAVLISCQKTKPENNFQEKTDLREKTNNLGPSKANGGENNCYAYDVTVVSNYNSGTNQTTFTWTIVNTNPGNGSNGTAKDLSHWDMILCDRAAANLVSQSNSQGNMVAPVYMVDPSLSCYTGLVLKFDYGTSGTTPRTYILVLSGNFSVDNTATGFFKAGTNCCTRGFPGISCEIGSACALSQGYWFANTSHSWNGATVTIGGFTYTQAEGQALWAAFPGGSGGNALKCFYQASAAMLSMPAALRPATINTDLGIINTYLTGLGKLTVSNHPNLNTPAAQAAVAAAGRISNWICANHCGNAEPDCGNRL
jgi:hypothetical protein